MNKAAFMFAATLLGFSSTAALADVSPTHFNGRGIKPISAPGIRMVSAKVDIGWGLPCNLSAIFVLDNQSSNAVDVQLGFPVSLPPNFQSKNSLDFTMSFDDVPEKPSDITEVGKQAENIPLNTTWYRCRHTFAPGQTTVKVTTKLPPTLVYRTPFREVLNYCIETGASWEGTIGSEEVIIHFPSPLQPDQIIKVVPPGCTIHGNTVQWKFKDFKPIGQDHDVSLEYLRPDVAALLTDQRNQLENDPTNAKLILNLAKNLFVLDRFGSSKQRFADEASNLVRHLLKANPHYADAWNLSFAHDPRYISAVNNLDDSLINEIQTAHEQCPNDASLQLWYERSKLHDASATQPSDAVCRLNRQLTEQLSKQGVYDVDYREIDYGYW